MQPVNVIPWAKRGNDCMRIGFSGSAGTGKTTLAKSVNEFMNFPYFEEGVREYLEAHEIPHLREMKPNGTMKMHLHLLKKRMLAEANAIKCVSDRTSYDNACYALYWLGREEHLQHKLMKYTMACSIHAIKTYDVIFILPFGVFDIEDDGCRSVKPAYQQGMQMMIEHAVQSGYPIHYVHQVQAASLDDRTAECMNIIDQLYDEKLKHTPPPTSILDITNPKRSKIIH